MIKKIEFRARVIDCQLTCFADTIDQLKAYYDYHNGKDVDVSITIDIDTRSKAQNRFFHGCLVPATQRILAELGHPNCGDTEYIKEAVLKKPYLTVNHGCPDEYVKSTRSLSVGEFWEFCNYCITLIVHLGGGLSQQEQKTYMEIVRRYHLNDALDQKLAIG